MGNESLGEEQDRLHVDVEDSVELGLVDFHQRLVAMGRPGIVDHDVDPAEGLDRCLCGALDIRLFRHVGGQRDRSPADCLRRRLGQFRLEVEAGDPRALAGEHLRDPQAKPLPRAGHQRGLAFRRNRSSRVRFASLGAGLACLAALDQFVVHRRRAEVSRPGGQELPVLLEDRPLFDHAKFHAPADLRRRYRRRPR